MPDVSNFNPSDTLKYSFEASIYSLLSYNNLANILHNKLFPVPHLPDTVMILKSSNDFICLNISSAS